MGIRKEGCGLATKMFTFQLGRLLRGGVVEGDQASGHAVQRSAGGYQEEERSCGSFHWKEEVRVGP